MRSQFHSNAISARSLEVGTKPSGFCKVYATIIEMESRVRRDDLYALRFLPEKPDLLAAVKAVKDSDVNVDAVTHINREAHKDVLYG